MLACVNRVRAVGGPSRPQGAEREKLFRRRSARRGALGRHSPPGLPERMAAPEEEEEVDLETVEIRDDEGNKVERVDLTQCAAP